MNRTDGMYIEIIKRYSMLCIGLFVCAMGISFSIRADLGTSPISSLPYVLSMILPFTVGNVTIMMHCAFILIQIILLRKNYKLIQLMQLPLAFIFGYFTDFALWLTGNLTYSAYWQQWILCLVGVVLVGVGVSIEVTANAIPLAGEGVILAVCKVAPIRFGTMKILFDVSLVAIACIISLFCMHRIAGVREGTVCAAICVGLIARIANVPMRKFRDHFIAKNRKDTK